MTDNRNLSILVCAGAMLAGLAVSFYNLPGGRALLLTGAVGLVLTISGWLGPRR